MDSNFYTFPRAQILTILKENPKGLTKEQIAEKTKINRTSVLHHLKILESRKLISISKPDKKKRGSPKTVTLTKKADPQTRGVLDLFEKLFSVLKPKPFLAEFNNKPPQGVEETNLKESDPKNLKT